MTEVQFHVNVPNGLHYTCRLLRKGVRKGVRMAVTGSPATLAELDRAIWVFEADEFLPHAHLAESAAPTAAQARAPVWLVEDARRGVTLPVLVNLGRELPQGFDAYERLIEIVSAAEDDRQAGRDRWRQYVARGYAPIKHDSAA